MTDPSWTHHSDTSVAEFDELSAELAKTIDDHDTVHSKATRFHHLRLRSGAYNQQRSEITTKLQSLRHHTGHDFRWSAPAQIAPVSNTCSSCGGDHDHQFVASRFDSVAGCLSAIRDLACYLEKSPRTIWLALEGIFSARQTTSARNLVRHRLAILARLLPAAIGLLLIALGLLHVLLPDHAATTGYTPVFSELGFLLTLTSCTTLIFFVLSLTMLVLKSTLQERFLNAFSRLVTWSIPIVLSFFMVSSEFLLLVQDLLGGSSQNVAGIDAILEQHLDIIETVYWTILVYVALYTGVFLTYIAFAKVFLEQRAYLHRHDVLRDVIPILVADKPTDTAQLEIP